MENCQPLFVRRAAQIEELDQVNQPRGSAPRAPVTDERPRDPQLPSDCGASERLTADQTRKLRRDLVHAWLQRVAKYHRLPLVVKPSLRARRYLTTMSDVMKELRGIREQRKLTVRQLAAMVGVSHQTISAWERGFRAPGVDDLHRWTSALGVSLSMKIVTQNPPQTPSEEAAELMAGLDPDFQEMLLAQVRAVVAAKLRRVG